MSQYRFLSRHTCQNVPSSLYRVQHPESQARFDDHGDLVARSAQELPDNEEDLKTQLEGHFRWGYSRRDSSFMSLLDSRNRAINWGKSRYRAQSRGLDTSNAKVNVYRVFPTEMPNAYIFKAEELCNWLDIRLNRDIAGEFLIASRIPAAAMRCIADIEALIYEGESRSKYKFMLILTWSRGRS